MKLVILYLAVVCTCFLSACEFKVDVKDKKDAPAATGKIRNGIQLKATGLSVSQAFLLDQNGNLVNDDNTVKVNEYLNLRLIIDDWTVKDGKVKLGASEKVETSDKELVLDEKDLFASINEVDPVDAKAITLKVVLQRVTKLYDYYLVSFRVWDKNGTGEVTGSYKFNIK
jgi:hypothetical protein